MIEPLNVNKIIVVKKWRNNQKLFFDDSDNLKVF